MEVENKSQTKTVLERNKFFATTNLAGFGFIQHSNNKLETVIWYVVIGVFTSITLYNIITLTIEYINQGTTATVRLATWDGNIGNDIYVEVPIVIPELYDEFYDKDTQYPFPYPYNRSLAADLDDAIVQLDSRDKLVGKNASWPPVLISLLGPFTSFMYSVEAMNLQSGNTPIEQIMESLMEKILPYVTKFRRHCTRFNVTDNEIMNKWFERIMTMYFNISVHSGREGSGPQLTDVYTFTGDLFNLVALLKVGSIGGISTYVLGFQLKKKIILERNAFNGYCHWKLNYENVIDMIRKSGVVGENITIDNIMEWLKEKYGIKKINVELILYNDIERKEIIVHIPFSRLADIAVKAVYSFQSLPDNKINNCSQANSKGSCIQECYVGYYVNSYHCTPMLFQQIVDTNTNLRPCSLEDYVQSKSMSSELGNCDYCPENCNQDILSFDQMYLSDESSRASMEFYLKPKFTPHPVFVELQLKSQTEYWADLGGTFDFWIGASVISAVHLIVYVCKQFAYAFKKNTKTGRNLRHFLNGSTGEDPTQMVTLLTLGLSQEQNNRENKRNDQVELLKIVKHLEESLKKITEQQEKLMKTVAEQEKRAENQEILLKTILQQEK